MNYWRYSSSVVEAASWCALTAMSHGEQPSQRWALFEHPRKVVIEELTFVRQGEDMNHWIDLASVPLGKSVVRAV